MYDYSEFPFNFEVILDIHYDDRILLWGKKCPSWNIHIKYACVAYKLYM